MNSAMFEDKFRDMQPATEDLLPNGRALQNGMVVLLEAPSLKADMSIVVSTILSNPTDLNRAKINNRWCEVSHVEIEPHSGPDGLPADNVTFVGTYSDGTKRKRQAPVGLAWFVKKDSLPKEEEPEPAEETVTFTQLGSGAKCTVPVSELRVEATETENAHDTEGSDDRVSEERLVEMAAETRGFMDQVDAAEVKQTRSFVEFHGRVEDIQSADGPLARALRQQ